MDDEVIDEIFDDYDRQIGVGIDELLNPDDPIGWYWDDWWKSERAFLEPGETERPQPKPKKPKPPPPPPPEPPRPSVFNELFQSGVAEQGESFIRDRLREVSFQRQITPPTKCTDFSGVCRERSALVEIIEIEPDARAMAITFRGASTSRVISKS